MSKVVLELPIGIGGRKYVIFSLKLGYLDISFPKFPEGLVEFLPFQFVFILIFKNMQNYILKIIDLPKVQIEHVMPRGPYLGTSWHNTPYYPTLSVFCHGYLCYTASRCCLVTLQVPLYHNRFPCA